MLWLVEMWAQWLSVPSCYCVRFCLTWSMVMPLLVCTKENRDLWHIFYGQMVCKVLKCIYIYVLRMGTMLFLRDFMQVDRGVQDRLDKCDWYRMLGIVRNIRQQWENERNQSHGSEDRIFTVIGQELNVSQRLMYSAVYDSLGFHKAVLWNFFSSYPTGTIQNMCV